MMATDNPALKCRQFLRMCILLGATAMGLVACGGGGGGGDSGRGSGTQVSLVSDVQKISTGKTNNVAILRATATNNGGQPASGVEVSFEADTGEFTTSPTVITDASGVATTTLSYGSDKSNRTIQVTATANLGDKNEVKSPVVSVLVTGTTVALAATPPIFIQGDTRIVEATVKDADGVPAQGVGVTVTSAAGNTVEAGPIASMSDGTADFGFTGKQVGVDTLTATIGGASTTLPITVNALNLSSISITLTPSSSTIQSGATNNTSTVTATVLKAGGVPVTGLAIIFAVNNGGTLTVVNTATDSNGVASTVVGYGTDKSNRALVVTATGGGQTATAPVSVEGTVISLVTTPDVVFNGSSSGWNVSLADADGVPITNVPVQLTIVSNNASVDYNLNPTSSPLAALSTDAAGTAPFTIAAKNNVAGDITGRQFTVKATYGFQQQDSGIKAVQANSSNQGPGDVTAVSGTNFPRHGLEDNDNAYGWVISASSIGSGVVGPTRTIAPTVTEYVAITVPVTSSTNQTITTTVKLRGGNSSHCPQLSGSTALEMNAIPVCSDKSGGNRLRVWYVDADNPTLQPGTYIGRFVVEGKVGATLRTFENKLIQLRIIKNP